MSPPPGEHLGTDPAASPEEFHLNTFKKVNAGAARHRDTAIPALRGNQRGVAAPGINLPAKSA